MSQLQEPQGVPFFSIKDGDTRYAKLEPQIQAYINSSDMGINASRGQDYGWRLGADWVKKVRAFRRDETKMSVLLTRNGGQRPTTTQILYAIYAEQLRNYSEQQQEEGAPYEEQYQQDISTRPQTQTPAPEVAAPDPLPETTAPDPGDTSDLNEVPEDVADEDHTVNRDAGDGQFVTDEEAAANPSTTVTETVKPGKKSGRPAKNK